MNFQGDTMSCLKHLYDAIKDDDNFFEKRETIATFTGVGESAVYCWFACRNVPKGEPLIKLRYYLECNGYEVTELTILEPTLKQVGKLLAFGILSIDEISNAVGYPAGRNGIDTLLKVLRGTQGVSKAKLSQFQTLAELYGDQLLKKSQNTPRVVKLLVERTSTPNPLPVRAPLRVVARPMQVEHDAIISALAGMVTAMLPLARLVSSDSFTPEDRTKVREFSGHEGVFDLANSLFSICGERSRAMRQQKAGE
ncbi:MAG: hypothetical protein RLZZ480_242 [Candidatus Parcubacteria bacterium]|jgi:hypothetical protein